MCTSVLLTLIGKCIKVLRVWVQGHTESAEHRSISVHHRFSGGMFDNSVYGSGTIGVSASITAFMTHLQCFFYHWSDFMWFMAFGNYQCHIWDRTWHLKPGSQLRWWWLLQHPMDPCSILLSCSTLFIVCAWLMFIKLHSAMQREPEFSCANTCGFHCNHTIVTIVVITWILLVLGLAKTPLAE